MLRRAPELECAAEDRASLLAIPKSRIEEAQAVERARIVLACLDGKEIQQVGGEVGCLHSHGYQVAPALLAVGLERITRPAAAR